MQPIFSKRIYFGEVGKGLLVVFIMLCLVFNTSFASRKAVVEEETPISTTSEESAEVEEAKTEVQNSTVVPEALEVMNVSTNCASNLAATVPSSFQVETLSYEKRWWLYDSDEFVVHSVVQSRIYSDSYRATEETVSAEEVADVFGNQEIPVNIAEMDTTSQELVPNEITLAMIDERIANGEEVTTGMIIWAIRNYLVYECDFQDAAASGVSGNIAEESQYSPWAERSGYYGMCQWNYLRAGGYWWKDVKNWILENGYDLYSFEGQIRAIIECSNRGLLTNRRLEELKNLTNVEQATELFAVFYESCVGGNSPTTYYCCGTCYQKLNERKSEAWVAYNMFENNSLEYNGVKPFKAP